MPPAGAGTALGGACDPLAAGRPGRDQRRATLIQWSTLHRAVLAGRWARRTEARGDAAAYSARKPLAVSVDHAAPCRSPPRSPRKLAMRGSTSARGRLPRAAPSSMRASSGDLRRLDASSSAQLREVVGEAVLGKPGGGILGGGPSQRGRLLGHALRRRCGREVAGGGHRRAQGRLGRAAPGRGCPAYPLAGLLHHVDLAAYAHFDRVVAPPAGRRPGRRSAPAYRVRARSTASRASRRARRGGAAHPSVPPTVMPSRRIVGRPTPTGYADWPSLPQVPTPQVERQVVADPRHAGQHVGPVADQRGSLHGRAQRVRSRSGRPRWPRTRTCRW